MKNLKFAAAALVVALAASCTANGGKNTTAEGADSLKTVKPVSPASLKPSKSMVDSVSYLIGVNFGSFIKGYNFGDVNYSQIKKGMEDFIKAKGDYADPEFNKQFKISPEEMNNLFNTYLGKMKDYTAALNKEKEAKFLASNQKKDSVQVTESGLQYIIREAGSDVKPGPKDTVYVHYVGTRTDGTVFDQSPKNSEGTMMILNRVVKGWTEGLQLIGEGGKIRLFIPSELGYGENGMRSIEPNSTLIFDIDLVSVNKVAPEEEPEK